MHFKNMVFIAQLYQHPSAGCIKCSAFGREKTIFYVAPPKVAQKTFPISRAQPMVRVESPLSAECTMKHTENCYKNKISITGVEKSFLFHVSLDIMRGKRKL